MPVKKTNRKSKKKVDKLPGLIMEQSDWPELPEKKHSTNNKSELEKKKFMMWGGVTFFIALILLVWGWNVFVTVQDTLTIQKEETNILEDATQDFKLLFDKTNEEKTEEVEKDIKEEDDIIPENIIQDLKNSLTKLMTELTTSTTPEAVVSTTPEN